MNIISILKILSILFIIVAGFMVFPIIVAVCYSEISMVKFFAIPIASALFFFLLIKVITIAFPQNTFSAKDGFIFATLSWLGSSALAAIPYCLSGAIPSFADAFFESMSGFTTTGASIISDIESLPKSILFWRAMTTWLGGMGIVVLTIAIFPTIGMGALQLLKAETTGPSLDKITPKITGTAKVLWLTYSILTALETILLMKCGGLDFFDAITHTFATVATGGFSTKNTSVEYFNSPSVEWIITVFMVLGGINFIFYFNLVTGKFQNIVRNTEIKAYFLFLIAATLIISFNLLIRTSAQFSDALRYAGFQVASIMTCSGFTSKNYADWPMLSQTVLFILMFSGGCSGSTAGGIKVIRIVTLLKQGINEMRLLLRPKGVFSIRINSKVINKRVVYSISGFVLLYIFLVFFITAVVATGDHDLLTSLSSAIATMGNIGPGFSKISPIDNYGFFQDYIKYVLSFAMLLGRLEIYTVLLLFLPSFWRK